MAALLQLPILYDVVVPNEVVPAPGRRPKLRGDCVGLGFNAVRPCQVTDCHFHLDSDKASCVLDVADMGGITLEEVGAILGVTRERVRQIEEIALRKLKRRGIPLGLVND